MNCLILDDHPDTAETLVECLRDMGRNADCAADAADAMARLEGGKYNCLGVDYFLNGGTGLDLVRRLRASGQQRLREMPVMVMTAGSDEVVARIAAELATLQPAAVIGKPFYPNAFLELMQRLRGMAGQGAT